MKLEAHAYIAVEIFGGSCFSVVGKKDVQNLDNHSKKDIWDIWGAEGQLLAENMPSEQNQTSLKSLFLLFLILCSVACRY